MNRINREGYIEPSQMTERQSWAVGHLAEHFHRASRLFQVSAEKTQEMKDILNPHGYNTVEQNEIATHMNTTTTWLNEQHEMVREAVSRQAETIAEQSLHSPPAPPAP